MSVLYNRDLFAKRTFADVTRSVYPNRDDDADACGQWAEEGMTLDMYLLGSILLHEYTYVHLPCSFKIRTPVSNLLDTGIGSLDFFMVAKWLTRQMGMGGKMRER